MQLNMRSPKKCLGVFWMPAIEVVEEKFKCSGVFPNAWNAFKCYGVPTSDMGCLQVVWGACKCLQVVWGAWKWMLCCEPPLVRYNSSPSLVRCRNMYVINSNETFRLQVNGGANEVGYKAGQRHLSQLPDAPLPCVSWCNPEFQLGCSVLGGNQLYVSAKGEWNANKV